MDNPTEVPRWAEWAILSIIRRNRNTHRLRSNGFRSDESRSDRRDETRESGVAMELRVFLRASDGAVTRDEPCGVAVVQRSSEVSGTSNCVSSWRHGSGDFETRKSSRRASGKPALVRSPRNLGFCVPAPVPPPGGEGSQPFRGSKISPSGAPRVRPPVSERSAYGDPRWWS